MTVTTKSGFTLGTGNTMHALHQLQAEQSGSLYVTAYWLSFAKPLFSWTPKSKKLLQYLSHRMFAAYAWSIKCRRKEKLIAQFGGKLRDESFKPN